MMRILLIILFCATSALAVGDMPIRVIVQYMSKEGVDKELECFLENTIKDHNPYGFTRKDEICKNFPAILEQVEYGHDFLSVEMTGLKNIPEFKEFSRRYDKRVNKLIWNVYGDQTPTAKNLYDALDTLSSVTEVELRGWSKFTWMDTANPRLENIKSLVLRDGSLRVLKFFQAWLPPASLRSLLLDFSKDSYPSRDLKEFFINQRRIKDLTIEGFSDNSAMDSDNLELESLSVDFGLDKNFEEQKTFLMETIRYNFATLRTLKLGGYQGSYENIDDAVFDEICKIRGLNRLELGVDNISMNKIGKFSDFLRLKSLVVKSGVPGNGQKLYKFGLQKMLVLEELTFYAPQHSIEGRTFERIAENIPNLTFLKVFGTDVKVNHLLQTLPNLAVLEFRYGIGKSLKDVFENGNIASNSLETFVLEFDDDQTASDPVFISSVIRSSPELLKLEIKTKFRFDPNFLLSLENNLGNIADLTLGDFVIPCNEKFGNREPAALLGLQKSADHVQISLLNEVETDDTCYYMEFGRLHKKQIGPYDPEFTFEPLIRNLKDHFTLHYEDRAYKTKTKKLTLIGGIDRGYME